jgi:hypothetical protein
MPFEEAALLLLLLGMKMLPGRNGREKICRKKWAGENWRENYGGL